LLFRSFAATGKCSAVEALLPGLTSTLGSIVERFPAVASAVVRTTFKGYDAETLEKCRKRVSNARFL
jgi:hypothetical protein